MLLTVTLNPAVDFTVFGGDFKIHKTNRGRLIKPDPGGKGNNVARIAHLLGADVVATGFLGGFTGRFIESELKREGIYTQFLFIDAPSRITLSHIEEAASRETKVVPFGPEIPRADQNAFVGHFETLLKNIGFSSVILSGSLPKLVEDGYYKTLMDIAHRFNVPVVLDTSGPSLPLGIEGLPFLIKPNLDEARELVKSDDHKEITRYFKEVSSKGTIVALTLGEGGALFFTDDRTVRIAPKNSGGKNPVGAGDAFVGGFSAAFDQFGKKSEKLFLWAVAAGTATAKSEGLLFPINLFDEIQKNLITETITDTF